MTPIDLDCGLGCVMGLLYILSGAFIWMPGLLSLAAGIVCGLLMSRLGRQRAFKVGLLTGISIIGLVIVWIWVFTTYQLVLPLNLSLGVYLALHPAGIVAASIICWYIHLRTKDWWDLRPRKQPNQRTHS